MGKKLDTLKKVFLVGLGATVTTAEKVKVLVEDLVDKGELSQSEGAAFAKELKARVETEKTVLEKQLKQTVDASVQKAIRSLGLATKKELDALRKELKAQSKTPSTNGKQSAAKKSSAKKSAKNQTRTK